MSRKLVEQVLSPKHTKALWSATYREALPITPQDFSMGAVLPMVMYLMRRRYRRGKGAFSATFRESESHRATIDSVAAKLSQAPHFRGFDDVVPRAILGDLLLAFCLENKKHRVGRTEQIQRAYPTHYFSSWIDLPEVAANLRNVPELITNLLISKGPFKSSNPGENLLLQVLGAGVRLGNSPEGLSSDKFDESTEEIGLDQLLTVRIANALEYAPQKLKGENPDIPKQYPIAERAANHFCEDLSVFLRAYDDIPRQTLVQSLESAMAVGMSTMYLSTISLLLGWADSGLIPEVEKQRCWPLFVDCSCGSDNVLRRYSEESVDELIDRLTRFAETLMVLRLIERWKVDNGAECPPVHPNPRMAFLRYGEWLRESDHGEGYDLRREVNRDCNRLAEALGEGEEDYSEICAGLKSKAGHPAFRLAEALVRLMGEINQFQHFRRCLDSCLMMDQPNGLARKRKSTVHNKMTERRSIVFTNPALEFLVHRHLMKNAKRHPLSLRTFIGILRDRYGFYLDESPPGSSLPQEDLRRNRDCLEKRLRDLGLLIGVNDAESMKRLRSRFDSVED